MADFTRLNRYRAELRKMRERRAEMDGKIKDMVLIGQTAEKIKETA